MPVQILKSQADKVAADFPAAVEQYRHNMLEHRFAEPEQLHVPEIPAQPAVAAIPAVPARGPLPGRPAVMGRPARPAVPAIPARPGAPRPTAHPLIEACIVRVQSPGLPDDFVADYEIVDDTPPPPTLQERKYKLMGSIELEEGKLAVAIWPHGKRRLDSIKQVAILNKQESARTAEEVQFLSDLTSKQNRLRDINLTTATLLSEIEDLTEETIGSWSGKLTEE